MLAELLRHPRLELLKSRLQGEFGERYALVTLAATAWLSFMIFVLVFVHPLGLGAFWYYNQLDLYGFSYLYPMLRWELIAAFLVLAFLYWVGWQAARRIQGRDAWMIVLWAAVASGIALLFVYPFGSTDIFDYILHGRMIAYYHANPFVTVGYNFPRDPFFPYMGWPGATSAYGPLWELLAAGVARLVGDGVIANVLAFKLLSGVFLAGSVWILAAILRQVAPKHVLPGVLLLAWNPVVLYETLVDGHNDMVMVFFVLAAVWAILNRRYTLAILALMAGALIKFMPLLLVPAAGLIALREIQSGRARLRFLMVTSALSIALVVLVYAPFWQGPQVLSVARRGQLFTTSLPSVIYAWLAPVWGTQKAASVVSEAAAALTLLFAGWQSVRAWRDRSWNSFARAAFNTFMFYLMGTVLWFMPWYSLWPLSLAPLLPSGRSVRLSHIFAFGALIQPLIVAPLLFWSSTPLANNWRQLGLATAFIVPWLYWLFARPQASKK